MAPVEYCLFVQYIETSPDSILFAQRYPPTPLAPCEQGANGEMRAGDIKGPHKLRSLRSSLTPTANVMKS